MEATMRSFFLHLSQNRTLSILAKRYGPRYGVQRFVAGETIDDAIETVRKMNRNGMGVTLDHLGEQVEDAAEARASAAFCLETLAAIHTAGVNASLSLKLTQLGLNTGIHLYKEHLRDIVDYASLHAIWVNIDMEDFSKCQVTLDLFYEFVASYPKIQTVIQSYLYRSETDVETFAKIGASIRIVKGAYKEPASVAYPDKADVDANYKRLLDIHLPSPGLTSIATHDEHLIDYAKRAIQIHGISESQYEFQMLYGIRSSLQHQLVQEGYPVRIYVPYGNDWYGYFMRRLAERPANVAFVLKGMFH